MTPGKNHVAVEFGGSAFLALEDEIKPVMECIKKYPWNKSADIRYCTAAGSKKCERYLDCWAYRKTALAIRTDLNHPR